MGIEIITRTSSTYADEARADCQYALAIRPLASAHNAAEPRTECLHLSHLIAYERRPQRDGHRNYHYLGLQEPMPMRLGQNANMPLGIQAHA